MDIRDFQVKIVPTSRDHSKPYEGRLDWRPVLLEIVVVVGFETLTEMNGVNFDKVRKVIEEAFK